MSPAEDALLLLRLAERHLGSLRGTLDPQPFAATFAAGAWPAMTPSPLPCRLNAGCC